MRMISLRCLATFGFLTLATVNAFAGKKVVTPETSAGNEKVDIVATITLTEEEVTQKIGADPGKGVVLLAVKVIPKTDSPILISPDDFILLAHDDGERSKPFEAAELAGKGALVLTTTSAPQKKGTTVMGGFGGIGAGGGNASPGNPKPTTVNSKVDNKTPGDPKLLEALRAKELTTKESVEPVEGYLYFPLDGKHKLKNLAVLYRGPAGKLDLEFEH